MLEFIRLCLNVCNGLQLQVLISYLFNIKLIGTYFDPFLASCQIFSGLWFLVVRFALFLLTNLSLTKMAMPFFSFLFTHRAGHLCLANRKPVWGSCRLAHVGPTAVLPFWVSMRIFCWQPNHSGVSENSYRGSKEQDCCGPCVFALPCMFTGTLLIVGKQHTGKFDCCGDDEPTEHVLLHCQKYETDLVNILDLSDTLQKNSRSDDKDN